MNKNKCPDCENSNKFCSVHQKHEKKVYESSQFSGRHDTGEFRIAIMDARQKDMLGE